MYLLGGIVFFHFWFTLDSFDNIMIFIMINGVKIYIFLFLGNLIPTGQMKVRETEENNT